MTPRTVASQAPLSMGFSRQEYWSGLPFPSPEELPNAGIEPWSPAWQADSLPFELQGSLIMDRDAKILSKILANNIERTIHRDQPPPTAQAVKILPASQQTQETQVQSLGREDPLEKEMAAHSGILAWIIPQTEEPDRLQYMGLQRVRHD